MREGEGTHALAFLPLLSRYGMEEEETEQICSPHST